LINKNSYHSMKYIPDLKKTVMAGMLNSTSCVIS
jgi:hypothetical protein